MNLHTQAPFIKDIFSWKPILFRKQKLGDHKMAVRRIICIALALIVLFNFYSILRYSENRTTADKSKSIKMAEMDRRNGDIHIAQVVFGVVQCRAAALALKSIMSKWKSKRKIVEVQKLHLHILCDAKSHIIMNTVLQTWQLKNVDYSFYLISDYKKKTAWMKSSHYATSVSTLRLYIPEILGKNITKVISLDTDVIFLDDISELWDFTDEANEKQSISMAKDESYRYTIRFHAERKIVLKGGCNVGVVLLHLDRLRQLGWTDLWQNALDALQRISLTLGVAEQDIFNVLIWMHKELFYPLPCVWNVQLNDAADLSVCSHSRSANGKRSDEQPNAKLLHMNREDKLEYNDDERLMIADVPETENVGW
uniref:Glycosyltransferase-like protein LARGE2 n=3 Tax=Schistocephalus solidus TaxID=70667 RepID=A0A0X3Q9D1_SCHSO